MRTTITIDDDVTALLKRELRQTGDSLKQVVNRHLRLSLSQNMATAKPKPFRVKSYKGSSLPAEWTSGCIQELINMVEGPHSR